MKQQPRHDTRERILAVAGRLFATKGYDDTSLLEIAKEVGVKKASLYYFFRDKEAMFAAVAEKVWDDMEQTAKQLRNEAMRAGKDEREVFAHILEAVIRHTIDAGNVMIRMQQMAHGGGLHSRAARKVTSMRKMLKDFLVRKKVREPDIAENVIINSIQGYVVHRRCGASRVSIAKYSQHLSSLFFKK